MGTWQIVEKSFQRELDQFNPVNDQARKKERTEIILREATAHTNISVWLVKMKLITIK